MSKEHIEREDAKARLRMWITDCVLDGDNEAAYCFRDCIDLLDSIPAADVAPVVHGRWIEYPVAHYFKCSECKYTVPYQKAALLNGKRSYTCCPHCHTVMDLEETNELDKREG